MSQKYMLKEKLMCVLIRICLLSNKVMPYMWYGGIQLPQIQQAQILSKFNSLKNVFNL